MAITARTLCLMMGVLAAAALGCSADEDGLPSGNAGGGMIPQIPRPGAGGSSGDEHRDSGTGNGGNGDDCSPAVVGLLRDFKADHPDFEYRIVNDLGIVAPELGADQKPVFAGDGHPSVHTAAEFNQWYNDTPEVNRTYEYAIDFVTDASGGAVYDNPEFFPLDGRGWGDEGNAHNYHFTFELHMRFRYNGGEVFTFRGDDDLFVFVNRKLAIDLGGVHSAQRKTLDLDQQASSLGIEPGGEYSLDFFQAERHTSKSSFRIESTLEFTNCEPIIVR